MITFSPMTTSDIEFFLNIRNSCAEKYLHCSTIFSIDDALSWYRSLNIPYYIVKYSNLKVGYFRLSHYLENNLLIGMDLHEKHRGIGIGFNSHIKFIPYVFNKYNANKLSSKVLNTNKVSLRLYKKLGFQVERIIKNDVYKNGKFVDSIFLSISSDDIENLKIYK
jgi:RimJ/RimL family protein N-acetyltransferase